MEPLFRSSILFLMPITGAGLIGLLYCSFPFSLVSLARSESWHYMKARHVTSPAFSLASHWTFTLQTHSSLNSNCLSQELLCWLYLNQPKQSPLCIPIRGSACFDFPLPALQWAAAGGVNVAQRTEERVCAALSIRVTRGVWSWGIN